MLSQLENEGHIFRRSPYKHDHVQSHLLTGINDTSEVIQQTVQRNTCNMLQVICSKIDQKDIRNRLKREGKERYDAVQIKQAK